MDEPKVTDKSNIPVVDNLIQTETNIPGLASEVNGSDNTSSR